MDLNIARKAAILAYDQGMIEMDTMARLLTAIGSHSLTPNEIPRLVMRTLELDPQQLNELVEGVHRRTELSGRRELAHQTMESEPLAPLRAAYSSVELREVGEAAPGETIRHRRYAIGRQLGRGGVGRVVLAWDRYLHRPVALKVALPGVTNAMENLAAEAKTTGGLEHPNIVSVYDFGVLSDGNLFYAMKYVRRHSLYEILRGIRLGETGIVEEYSRARLLTVFQQVCMAIHYAHAKGVLHRDIKPDNIMVGEYGEVLVMDWGLALVYAGGNADPAMRDRAQKPSNERRLVGTPEYMPPEQARGLISDLSPATDVYALGALLYEMLTLRPPHVGKTATDVVYRVLHNRIAPPCTVAPDRDISDELQRIVMKALAHEPSDRFESARALYDEVEAFIDGRRRLAERKRETDAAITDAIEEIDTIRRLDTAIAEAQRELDGLRASIEPDASADERSRIWDCEERIASVTLTRMESFERAEAALQIAYALMPGLQRAQKKLAELYFVQAQSPIWSNDRVWPTYYERQVRRYDADGLGAQLDAPGRLLVRGGFDVATLSLLNEESRRLRPKEIARLVPGAPINVPPGRYEVSIRSNAARSVISTCIVRRAETLVMDVGDVAVTPPSKDFVLVPGGPAMIGGDRLAHGALPANTVELEPFFASAYPVTFGEYAAFLSALYKRNPEDAIAHMPRIAGGGMLCDLDPGTGYRPGIRILGAAPPESGMVPGSGVEWMVPVFGINFTDAIAYIAWRSEKDGVPYRLLSEAEWEKVARGGDGRYFPWGMTFDSSFCLNEMTHQSGSWPEPVGIYHADVGPSGARDLAGGTQTFTSDLAGDKVVVKGGAWSLGPIYSRCASRRVIPKSVRLPEFGLRLAISAPKSEA